MRYRVLVNGVVLATVETGVVIGAPSIVAQVARQARRAEPNSDVVIKRGNELVARTEVDGRVRWKG